jgi:hypothetical protein
MVKKFVPRILARVTIPFLKLNQNQPVYITVKKAMFEGKKIDDKKEPATILEGHEWQRNELIQMIAGAVLKNELDAAYPNDGYVGKCFEIVMHKAPKKNSPDGVMINLYNITEIGEPDSSDFVEMNEAIAGEETAQREAVEAKRKADNEVGEKRAQKHAAK